MPDWSFANLPRPEGSLLSPLGTLDDPSLSCLHPTLKRLVTYWRGKCAQRIAPSRADIDPLELGAALLPHVMLIDVISELGKRRYRFRLAGAEAGHYYAIEANRRYFDEVLPPRALAVHTWIAEAVVSTRLPLRSIGVTQLTDLQWLLTEAVAFPILQNGEVTMLLVGAVRWPEGEPPPAA
mgnify:CR=1 FL=1